MNRYSIRIVIVVTILATAVCLPAGAEERDSQNTIDEGRIIRPHPAPEGDAAVNKAYGSSTENFIIRWLAPSRGTNGSFDDDLIGENSVVPSCASSPIGGNSTSPIAYTSGSAFSDGRIYLN